MSTSGSRLDDREIESLLREAGSAYDPPALDALIEGVLAAPAEVGTSWHMLVADPVTPALADALEARRAAKGYRNGLATEDFALLPRSARIDLLRRELAARGLDGEPRRQGAAAQEGEEDGREEAGDDGVPAAPAPEALRGRSTPRADRPVRQETL